MLSFRRARRGGVEKADARGSDCGQAKRPPHVGSIGEGSSADRRIPRKRETRSAKLREERASPDASRKSSTARLSSHSAASSTGVRSRWAFGSQLLIERRFLGPAGQLLLAFLLVPDQSMGGDPHGCRDGASKGSMGENRLSRFRRLV